MRPGRVSGMEMESVRREGGKGEPSQGELKGSGFHLFKQSTVPECKSGVQTASTRIRYILSAKLTRVCSVNCHL